MRARPRPTAATRASALTAALVCGFALSGCAGEEEPAQAGATTTPPGSVPSAPAGASPASGRPRLPSVPKVRAAEVKGLVGRWVSPAGDYFQFKADGTGSWVKGGRSLWSGQVIPEGKGEYRFSWQGGDPQTASYWGATLTAGKLLFAGTNQTYTKAGG